MINIQNRYDETVVVEYGRHWDYYYSKKEKHLVSSNHVDSFILATGITLEDAKSLVETMEREEK